MPTASSPLLVVVIVRLSRLLAVVQLLPSAPLLPDVFATGALAAYAGASQAADDADAPQATDERGALDAFGGAFKKASTFTTRLCVRSMGFLPRALTNCSAQPRKTSRRRHSRCV